MKMHTAQHLVSGIVYEEFNGARTVGNQIHQDRSRIDFNPIKFDDEKLELLKQKFDEKVSERLEVSIKEMTRDEINSIMPPDRTNMDLMPKSVKNLRIIEIGNQIDLCPCAGTHVRNIGELGEIEFLGKKVKEKARKDCRILYDEFFEIFIRREKPKLYKILFTFDKAIIIYESIF